MSQNVLSSSIVFCVFLKMGVVSLNGGFILNLVRENSALRNAKALFSFCECALNFCVLYIKCFVFNNLNYLNMF